MPNVHHHAHIPRPFRHIQQLAVLVNLPHRLAGEAVGEDIARAQEFQHITQFGRSFADMYHHRQFTLLGGEQPTAEPLDASPAGCIQINAHLDPQNEVPVDVDQLATEIDIHVIQIRQLPR